MATATSTTKAMTATTVGISNPRIPGALFAAFVFGGQRQVPQLILPIGCHGGTLQACLSAAAPVARKFLELL
jgi:hypothetical protein